MNAEETLIALATKLSSCESDCLRLAERGSIRLWEASALRSNVADANALAMSLERQLDQLVPDEGILKDQRSDQFTVAILKDGLAKLK